MPRINLIAAMAHNRVIGKDNQMPWHLPADLKHFKAITLNHPVIMGRETYQSIGKALPNRRNVVITRDQTFTADDAEIFYTLESAITACDNVAEVMIIGGANIYQQMLSKADKLYITLIDLTVEGDSHFPDWQQMNFNQISSKQHYADEKNLYDYQFITLERFS